MNGDAFISEVITRAADDAADEHHREHGGQYFKANRSAYRTATVRASSVFGDHVEDVPDPPSVRLTMDEPADYRVLSRIYDVFADDDIVDTAAVIRYVVNSDLGAIKVDVTQDVW